MKKDTLTRALAVLAALAERKKAAEAPQQAEDTGEMK